MKKIVEIFSHLIHQVNLHLNIKCNLCKNNYNKCKMNPKLTYNQIKLIKEQLNIEITARIESQVWEDFSFL